MDLVVSVAFPSDAGTSVSDGHMQGPGQVPDEALRLLYSLPDSFNALYVRGGVLAYLPSWAKELVLLCGEISDELQGEQTQVQTHEHVRTQTPTDNARRSVSFASSDRSYNSEPVCAPTEGLAADLLWVWTLLQVFLGHGCDDACDDEFSLLLVASESALKRSSSTSLGSRFVSSRGRPPSSLLREPREGRERSHRTEAVNGGRSTAANSSARQLPRTESVQRRARVGTLDIPSELLEGPAADTSAGVSGSGGGEESGAGADSPGLRAVSVLRSLTEEERRASVAVPQPEMPVNSLDDLSEDGDMQPTGGSAAVAPVHHLCPRRLTYRAQATVNTPMAVSSDSSSLQLVSSVFNRQLSAQVSSVKRQVASQLFFLASGGSIEDSSLLEVLFASGLAHLFCNVCALLLADMEPTLALAAWESAPPSWQPLARRRTHALGSTSGTTVLQRVAEHIFEDYLQMDYISHSCRLMYTIYAGSYDFSGEKLGLARGGAAVLSATKTGCGYVFAYSVVTLLIRHHHSVLKHFSRSFGAVVPIRGSSANMPVDVGVEASSGTPVYARRVSQSELLYRGIVDRLLAFLSLVGLSADPSAAAPVVTTTTTTRTTVTTSSAAASPAAPQGGYLSGAIRLYLCILSVFFTYVVANHYRRKGMGFKFHTLEWLQKCFLIKLQKTYAFLVDASSS